MTAHYGLNLFIKLSHKMYILYFKTKQTFIETQSGEQCGTIELRLFFMCVLFHRCTYGWLVGPA